MKRQAIVFFVLMSAAIRLVAETPLSYPAARREKVIDNYHGVKVADPYRWLEKVDSRETVDWVNAQNHLTVRYIDGAGFRERIRRQLASLWNYSWTDVPWQEAGRLFFLSNTGLQPQPVLYSQKNLNDPPQVVFDPNKYSPDGSVAIRDYVVSPDGRLLAYTASQGGADAGDVHLMDMRSGATLSDTVSGVLTSVCWTRDSRGFFYVRRGLRSDEEISLEKAVLYHTLGHPQTRDRLVYEWKENTKWVYCMISEDGRYALFVAEQGRQSEIQAINLVNADQPKVNAPPFHLLGDYTAFHTPIDFVGDTLYVRTNLEAERGRVIALDLKEGQKAKPRSVIPEGPDVIADVVITANRIAMHYLADVKSRLRLFDLNGKPVRDVTLPGIGAIGWPLGGRPSSSHLFYSFASFLAPSCVYHLNLHDAISTPFRPPRVPFDDARYETKQIFYASKDGTRVPMFITAAKDLKLGGTNPVLLTAYGGYGAAMEPSYQPDIPLWLESGGVYAVANIRGGGEYGEEWHRAGMLERKQNSFDDFIAAAEYLIEQRYTSPSKLAIHGHSNGGLLVGAVITQRPDLFAAAVANAGHYDMLRYHKFTVGSGWISEYGSPDDPAAFPYLHAYSPLQKVRAGVCYPATLLLAADHDDRVVPSHAYKFAATLQAAQNCNRPILLHVAINASHSYASRQAQIEESSVMWVFIMKALGVVFGNAR